MVLPGLQIGRRLVDIGRKTVLVEQFVTKDRDGLLFDTPFRRHADTVYESGTRKIVAPSTQVVDAAGSVINPARGLITTAQANVLRIGGAIDFASRRRGALFEELRRNTCLQSEDLSTTWSPSEATVLTNATTAPDGATTADKLVESTGVSTAHQTRQDISVISGEKVVVSFFAKKSEREEVFLNLTGTAAPESTTAWFDLIAGTVGTLGAGIDDSGIDFFPNGWFRCWVVFTADATDTFRIRLNLGSGSETSTYTGDGTSGAFFWGIQCEQNVPFHSSYIKTTTLAVTRAADDIQYGNASEVNMKAAAGTLIFAFTPQFNGDDLTNTATLMDSREASNNNGVRLAVENSGGKLQLFVRSGAATSALIIGTTVLQRGTTYVITIVWQADEFRIYVDGTEEASQTSSAPAPTALFNVFSVGSGFLGAGVGRGNLAHFHIYDSVLPAARVLKNTNEIRAWLGV